MSTADDDDYYAVLGCPRSATQDELRRAYHRLARALHPDRRPDAAAHAQMARVGEAWAILKNPRLRAVYDRDGREGVDDLSDAASDDGEGSSFPRGWPGAATSGASPSSSDSEQEMDAGDAKAPPRAGASEDEVALEVAKAVAIAIRRTEQRAALRYERALASMLRALGIADAEAARRGREEWAAAAAPDAEPAAANPEPVETEL